MTDSRNDATRYAFRLLGYRGRSEKELRERLVRKGFPEDAVSHTVAYLREAGFINDNALALELKRQAVGQKKLGYRAARSFMEKRGLPREIVESALEYDEDAEIGNARDLLKKKHKSVEDYLTTKERKRLYDFLLRKGFSSSVIRKALSDFEQEEGDEG